MLDMTELSRLGMVEAVELTCRHDSLLMHLIEKHEVSRRGLILGVKNNTVTQFQKLEMVFAELVGTIRRPLLQPKP